MKKKISVILIIIFAVAIFIKAELEFNPSVRVLLSVIDFSESTLNSSDYLAYDVDLKDLFRNNINADISYEGSAYIKKLKGFPYSINGNISGQRSYEQKQFSCKSDLNVLVINVGKLDIYAKDDTVYLVAPLLGNISYGFDTDNDLFLHAPDLNNDINEEWFHNNKANIFNFIRQIDIQKTDETFVDEDGTICQEYKITIQKGQGDFIWNLLGMKAPDHDITWSLFLDKFNHTRKVVFDLSYKTEGAYCTVYGNNLNTFELHIPLPDDESTIVTIKRNGNTTYTHAYSNNISYFASTGDVYSADFNTTIDFVDDGMEIEASDVAIQKNTTMLAEGYLKGNITPTSDMGDVFENAHVDLSDVTVIDWDTIKNDTASFVDDVISQAREKVDILNLFN